MSDDSDNFSSTNNVVMSGTFHATIDESLEPVGTGKNTCTCTYVHKHSLLRMYMYMYIYLPDVIFRNSRISMHIFMYLVSHEKVADRDMQRYI